MAEPRVFISSTFYDLKHVRSDLDIFISSLGYMSIRHDVGDIPYGKNDKLEEYCYREISLCDILISIVGGKFGHSSSVDKKYSISQLELKVAIEIRRQVYIFIERGVYNEYLTYQYQKEEERKLFTPRFADSTKIYDFILEILSLPNNNPVFQFDTSQEIIEICKKQWAGLYQRLLLDETKSHENEIINELNKSLNTVKDLIDFISIERKEGASAFKNILLPSHPIFELIKNCIKIPFRVFFTSIEELKQLLVYFDFKEFDIYDQKSDNKFEWYRISESRQIIRIHKEVFSDDGKLIVFSPNEWKSEFFEFT